MEEFGIVAWFDSKEGFGFIKRIDGTNIFVHHTKIIADEFRLLKQGQQVQFEAFEGPEGLQANNVITL